MTSIADPSLGAVYGGVDTHRDTVHAAAIDAAGRALGDREFATTATGYQQLLRWLGGLGAIAAVGVEGTGSYGAGVTGYLTAAEVTVVDVDRPDRAARRRAGKSDPIDAYAAAHAARSGRATTVPKAHTGIAEAIRVIKVTRRGAINSRTVAVNELKNLLVTAPVAVREALPAPGATQALLAACTRLRPGPDLADPTAATKQVLRRLARRVAALTDEITDADAELAALTATAAPQLLDQIGIGPETAATMVVAFGDNSRRVTSDAAFAKLCGVAPLEATSGQRRNRHRLNRGGNRDANRALYVVAITRLRHCPRTRDYVTRRTTEGLSNRDILRCLKRYIAREIYYLINPGHPSTRPIPPTHPGGTNQPKPAA